MIVSNHLKSFVNTHTHTHTHIYIYIYICTGVRVCMWSSIANTDIFKHIDTFLLYSLFSTSCFTKAKEPRQANYLSMTVTNRWTHAFPNTICMKLSKIWTPVTLPFPTIITVTIYIYTHISFIIIDIFCLHIFLSIISYCRIDFKELGGNWLIHFP